MWRALTWPKPRIVSGITAEPVGVVHVLVPDETTMDGLARQTDAAVPTVLAVPVVRQGITRPCGRTEDIVKLAIGA
jgi:hypothetical protein